MKKNGSNGTKTLVRQTKKSFQILVQWTGLSEHLSSATTQLWIMRPLLQLGKEEKERRGSDELKFVVEGERKYENDVLREREK